MSRDVMIQASLGTHRWVCHLGYSRHTRSHTGGKTDPAALQNHTDKYNWRSDTQIMSCCLDCD